MPCCICFCWEYNIEHSETEDSTFLFDWVCPCYWCYQLDLIDYCYTPCYCCWYQYKEEPQMGQTDDKVFNQWIYEGRYDMKTMYRFAHTLGRGSWKIKGPKRQDIPDYENLKILYEKHKASAPPAYEKKEETKQ